MTVSGKAAQVLDALLARVAALTLSPVLPVDYPEAAFDTPADGKYLAVSFYPNRPMAQGLTSARVDQGLLQITVVWPKNHGLIAPNAIVQAVINHFPNALALQSGATRVKISGQAWTAAPITDTDRVSIPITIPWTA
jgi:hypothetical protein